MNLKKDISIPIMAKKLFKKIIIISILCLTFAMVFVWAVFNITPLKITQYLGTQLASVVGISTSVPSNPFSELARQLQEKEYLLENKEKQLEVKEEELLQESFLDRYWPLFLILTGGILLILILINFYFDHRRKKFFRKIL